MAKGTVKWFNPTNEGQTVEYEEVANRGKTSAEHLKV
jgi:cold shock CspA family protein